MAIKVKLTEIEGEKRVPPEVMDLLVSLGHHKQFCPICEKYMDKGIGDYCSIGTQIILKLAEQPEVEFTDEPKK